MRIHRACIPAFAFALSASAAPLDAFNVDTAQTSVSGISSGGYMAVQFHVAYSGSVMGAGIVAGGPYYCAKGNVATALTDCTTPTAADPPDAGYSIRVTDAYASRAAIDAPANLARSKVWLFSGSLDTTVYPVVMDQLAAYYAHYVDPSRVTYVKTVPAAHSMVTDGYGAACDHKGDANVATDHFINDCRYDAAGKILAAIYGPLNAKASAPTGHLVSFAQDAFIDAPTTHSMDDEGYAYVPLSCDRGARCRIHVAFHGCLQYADRIGDDYARNAGYNAWADTNDLIVLYPQAAASALPPVYNPKGCWDWWGYDDANYATRDGRQMRAVKAMIDRLASGYRGDRAVPPGTLRVTATDDHSVALAWDASTGPRTAYYRIYVASSSGGSAAVAGTATGTRTTVSGLAAGSSYAFTVRTVDRLDAESAPSNVANAATTGHAPLPLTPATLLAP